MRRRGGAQQPLPSDPDCADVGAVLQAYLDGELGAGDAEIVAEHLRHCGRCGIEEATVRRVVAAIRRQRPDLDPAPIDRLGGFVERLTGQGPADTPADGGGPPGSRG